MNIKNRIIEYRTINPSDVKPNPRNWRTHPQNQRDALRGILADVGIAGVVLAYYSERYGGLTLIDGHERMTVGVDFPCAILDVNDEEADKLLATFDPIGNMAGLDSTLLNDLLHDVSTDSPALQQMLADLVGDAVFEEPAELLTDPDAVPDEVATICQRGDLWVLGEHRLLCGDSTIASDVERVMDGGRAVLVFTDPPYGVSIGKKNVMLNSFQKAGRNLTDIESDDLSPEALKDVLTPAFTNIRTIVMRDDCSVMVTAPQGGDLSMMMMMMKDAGLPVRHVLIWMKNAPTFSMGRLDYDYQHEPILFTWGDRHKRVKSGDHQTSIWQIAKPRSSKEHPTMKPVGLVENAILNHTDPDDVVFDSFGGSGTTLIACERQRRRCRMIELSPHYCDVIIKRWEEATGKTAVKEE